MRLQIGNKIKELREQKKLTKTALGQILDVSSSAIGQYEKNVIEPKNEVLLKLNKEFKYDFFNNKPDNGENNSENGENNISEPDENPYQSNSNTTNQNNTMEKEGLNHEVIRQLIIRINELERQINEKQNSQQTNAGS